MSEPLAVFRADASARIGGGHVHRCLAIAAALQNRNWRCAFATVPDSLSAVPSLAAGRIEVLTLPEERSAEAGAMRARWPAGPAALLVDHYERDISFELELQGWGRVLVALDDLTDRRHAVDLLIDPTPVRRGASRHEQDARRMLLGPSYAPLRPEWAQSRAGSLARDRAAPVHRMLVSLGSIDAENVTADVVRTLARFEPPCEIVVVLGPDAPHKDEVATLTAADPRFRLAIDPTEFAKLAASCDLVIGAAGSTSWERCCLGIPSAVIVVADNQRRNAEALAEAKAAWIVGEPIGRWRDELLRAVETLASDGARRVAMGQSAAGLCDGLGAGRIADAMIEGLRGT